MIAPCTPPLEGAGADSPIPAVNDPVRLATGAGRDRGKAKIDLRWAITDRRPRRPPMSAGCTRICAKCSGTEQSSRFHEKFAGPFHRLVHRRCGLLRRGRSPGFDHPCRTPSGDRLGSTSLGSTSLRSTNSLAATNLRSTNLESTKQGLRGHSRERRVFTQILGKKRGRSPGARALRSGEAAYGKTVRVGRLSPPGDDHSVESTSALGDRENLLLFL